MTEAEVISVPLRCPKAPHPIDAQPESPVKQADDMSEGLGDGRGDLTGPSSHNSGGHSTPTTESLAASSEEVASAAVRVEAEANALLSDAKLLATVQSRMESCLNATFLSKASQKEDSRSPDATQVLGMVDSYLTVHLPQLLQITSIRSCLPPTPRSVHLKLLLSAARQSKLLVIRDDLPVPDFNFTVEESEVARVRVGPNSHAQVISRCTLLLQCDPAAQEAVDYLKQLTVERLRSVVPTCALLLVEPFTASSASTAATKGSEKSTTKGKEASLGPNGLFSICATFVDRLTAKTALNRLTDRPPHVGVTVRLRYEGQAPAASHPSAAGSGRGGVPAVPRPPVPVAMESFGAPRCPAPVGGLVEYFQLSAHPEPCTASAVTTAKTAVGALAPPPSIDAMIEEDLRKLSSTPQPCADNSGSAAAGATTSSSTTTDAQRSALSKIGCNREAKPFIPKGLPSLFPAMLPTRSPAPAGARDGRWSGQRWWASASGYYGEGVGLLPMGSPEASAAMDWSAYYNAAAGGVVDPYTAAAATVPGWGHEWQAEGSLSSTAMGADTNGGEVNVGVAATASSLLNGMATGTGSAAEDNLNSQLDAALPVLPVPATAEKRTTTTTTTTTTASGGVRGSSGVAVPPRLLSPLSQLSLPAGEGDGSVDGSSVAPARLGHSMTPLPTAASAPTALTSLPSVCKQSSSFILGQLGSPQNSSTSAIRVHRRDPYTGTYVVCESFGDSASTNPRRTPLLSPGSTLLSPGSAAPHHHVFFDPLAKAASLRKKTASISYTPGGTEIVMGSEPSSSGTNPTTSSTSDSDNSASATPTTSTMLACPAALVTASAGRESSRSPAATAEAGKATSERATAPSPKPTVAKSYAEALRNAAKSVAAVVTVKLSSATSVAPAAGGHEESKAAADTAITATTLSSSSHKTSTPGGSPKIQPTAVKVVVPASRLHQKGAKPTPKPASA